jgi:hypothetical protein
MAADLELQDVAVIAKDKAIASRTNSLCILLMSYV